jgi:cyclophilin family peptidyl-prolyl cis-trans isomerase
VIKEEDSYGSNTGNGTWNGMVGVVTSGNADTGVSAFFVTKEQSEVVDFTYALGSIR